MVTLSRMLLADVGSPEALVAGILKQAPDITLPIPIEEIARALDIEAIEYLETDGFDGSLICTEDKNRGTILVSSGKQRQRQRQRQRFTIGHELGHFLIPTHKPSNTDRFVCTTQDMRRWSSSKGDRAAEMEVEANRFSAELLMPKTLFRRDLVRRKGCDLTHILELAKRYDVSKEATTRRYTELHHEPCAAIISNNGLIRSVYRPKAFPYIVPGPAAPVPIDSLTARFSGSVDSLSDWEQLDGSVWLTSEFGRRTQAIYEQVLVQLRGFRLTLLVVDSKSEEEDEEEEGLVRSWQVGFHKKR